MQTEQKFHRFRILFPNGELIYSPHEGYIFDPLNGRQTLLPIRSEYSLVNSIRERQDPGASYSPNCLTLYSSHLCNLACSYCYIPGKEDIPEEFLDPAMVESGARIVAENCKESNKPFVLGFHGGNEPLLHAEKTAEYLDICKSVATDSGVSFLPFCTTNGVVAEETARWAADRFHGITLSWDGPDEIHDIHRKDRSGNNSASQVKRSARIFLDPESAPPQFLVRCTITSASVTRMEELTTFFHRQGVRVVEYYPSFQNKIRAIHSEIIPDPASFVFQYLKAKIHGKKKGMSLLFSGSRLLDRHGRYCMIFQDNLTLTPDGFVTSCYQRTHKHNPENDRFIYGSYDRDKKTILLDQDKLTYIAKKCGSFHDKCSDCFNQYHCSMACPDLCPMDDGYQGSCDPGCIKEEWLGLAAILESAGYELNFSNEAECTAYFNRISHEKI